MESLLPMVNGRREKCIYLFLFLNHPTPKSSKFLILKSSKVWLILQSSSGQGFWREEHYGVINIENKEKLCLISS